MSNTLLKHRPGIVASMETIDFQNDVFGVKLETPIAEIIQIYKNNRDSSNIDVSEQCKKIEVMVEKRLGLKIALFTNSHLGAVIPLYANKHHVLLNKMWRGNVELDDQNIFLRDLQNRKGHVDLKAARVGGIYSEYRHMVFLNVYQCVYMYKLNTAEIVAILLHELGHAFYACEYSDRLETTNQVLANIALEVTGKKQKNLDYVYKELKSINDKVTEEDVDLLVNGTRIVAGYRWFKVAIESVQGQKESAVYDRTSFEALADNFAARFGYGKQLIIALDKARPYFGDPEKSKTWGFIATVLGAAWGLGSIAVVIAVLSSSPLIGLIWSLVLFSTFFHLGENSKGYTYDDLRVRYKRIRNEQIQLLKDSKLPNEDIKNILDIIYQMDAAIDSTREHSGLFTAMSNLIFKTNRDAKRLVNEEKALEDLAANDLFLKAAQFKTL